MSCSIIQDPITKEIISVLAPNGQPSRLYQEILNNIEPDREKALRLWAQVYTPTFKNENGDWESKYYNNISAVQKNINEKLPKKIAQHIQVIDKVPIDIIGNRDIQFSMQSILEKTDIKDPLLINWMGINKNKIDIRNITSTNQLLNIITNSYNSRIKNAYPLLKGEAKIQFDKWIDALNKYPIAFNDQILKYAIKNLIDPKRTNKFITALSEIALSNSFRDVSNQSHKLNQVGKIYNSELLKNTSDATQHEPSASGSGYWVHVPRTDRTSEQHKANEELLRKLSPHTWCTSSSMASHYVENYDNYILIVDGKTVAGIEAFPPKSTNKYNYVEDSISEIEYKKAIEDFYEWTEDGITFYVDISDNVRYKKSSEGYFQQYYKLGTVNIPKIEVKEVTSIANNGIAPIDYLDDILAFFEKHNLNSNNETIQRAIKAKQNGKTDADFLSHDADEYNEPDFYDEWNDDYYYNDDEYAAAREADMLRAANVNTIEDAINYIATSLFGRFDLINNDIRANKEVAEIAIEKTPHNIAYIDHNLPFYLALAHQAMLKSGFVYNYLSEEAKQEQRNIDIFRNHIEFVDNLPFSKTSEDRIQGYYDANNDKIVVIASNVKPNEAAKVGIHEVAHRGMLRMAKELGGTDDLYEALKGAKKELFAKLPELLERTGHNSLNSLMSDYGFDTNSKEGELKLLMELSARWAESFVDKTQPSWWKKLLLNIRQWIKKYTGVELNESQVNELIGGFVQYGTTIDQKSDTSNRSGVEELFQENPELANAVYEALGFSQKDDFKQTFKNSLWRGQESQPFIDKNGNLVLIPTYDSLFKSEGISFAENLSMAQGYGERYSKNPFIIEIDKNYADKIYPLDRQGGTKNYGKRVVGDENEQRFISKEHIIIPKDKFKIHKKELIYDFSKTSTLNLVNEWAKQFIEADIAEFNRYGESLQGYATEDKQYYIAVQNELKNRGVTNEELLFLKPANPIEGEEIIRDAFNIEDVTQKDIDAFLKKQKELQQKYYNKELDVKDSFGFKKTNIKISEKFQITPQQKQQAQQLYSQYLDTIFPESKVKDIQVHFTPEKNKQSIFDSGFRINKPREKDISFISIDKSNQWKDWFRNTPIYVLLNIKKPAGYDRYSLKEKRQEDVTIDGGINIKTGPSNYATVVFEPEQIHILGNKQDVEGFREFVSNEASSKPMIQSQGTELSNEGLKLDENGEPDIQYVRDSRVEEHVKEKNDPNYNQNKIDQYVANSVVGAVADRLAENLGVNYNIITPQQAREITSTSQIPWNGEKAFYYNGEVYFINEGFNINNVIHEFSHPLVSALFIDNKPLFDKLYQDILKTIEGQSIESEVERLYSEFSKDSIQFKSEVLVRAITKAAVHSSPPAGLRDFAQKVIFAFKQLFRKLFGQKIKIEKLSLNTTISDLAKMLKGDVFTLDVEAIRNNLAVDYARDITNFTNELEQIEYSAVSISVRRFYDLVSNHIRRIRENKNYSEVREFLVEESGRGQLQELKSTLQATEIDERLKDILSDLEIQKRTAQNFVHSLLRVNKMLDKISTHIKTLSETEPDEKNVILNIFYYDLLLRNWDKLITEISDNLQESGLRPNTDMGNLLSNMKSMIDFNNRQISKIYSNKTYSVLYEHIEPTAKAVDEYFEKTLQEAREKNFSEAKIKDIEQRYEKMKITKEKVRDMLLGRMGDTNMFSAFFESYTENPDPIVGGFTMLIKNAYNEVSAETQTKLYDFINEIKPYLEDAGYQKGNFSAVTKQMVFEDNVPFINDKGNFDTKKVWTLINPFKDRGVELAKLNYRLDKAISENNEQEIDNIQSEIRKHKVDYFHQEYVDEYYQKERIYDEPFGQEAFRRKRLILESIRQLDVLNYDDDALTEIAEQKKLLWRQYAQLASLTDEFGEPKVGDELEIAKVERKYRVESRKFFEWKPVKGMFESALRRFEQLLVDAGYPEGSEEFINRKELWIKNNTVTSYTQEFFEKRNETLRKIKDLMAQIPEPTRSEIDTSVDMEALLDISVGFRDQHGQIIGTDMSERTREKVYNRQEEIIKKREKLAGYSGLTVDQMDRLSELFEKMKFKGQLSTIEQEEFDDLLQIKGSLGVSKETKIELQKAFAELSELQSREATDYYVDIVNNHLSRMGEDPIDNDTASNLLDISYINKYFVKSPEFKAWFLKNHIEKYVWDSKEKERVKKYERLFIWNRTRPNDPNHYVVTTLSNGEVINGKPTLSYEYRRVKDEYRTERIVGKTVDNLGNWLPKTLAEGAKDARYINPEYEKLRRNSPAIFRLLEKTSSAFIELQADSPRQSKLYLQIPRYRKMSSELLRKSKDTLTKWYKAVRQIFVSANDDVEDGLNFNAEKLIYADMFDEEISKVPITGLYNLDSEEVSLNIYDSIFRYVYSATKQKKLIELNPFAQSLLKVVDDPKNGIKDMSKINKFIFQKSGIKRFIGIKGVSQRADALHNIYEREFEGIRKKGYLSDFRPLHKLISLGAKVGAFGTFAMNISPSAIKNRAAGLIQLYIDAAGGRYINMKSYTLGLPRAYKMLTSLSSNLYNIDNKNVDFQLLQAFDPTQGLFEMTLGTGSGSDKGGMFGRSITSDGATLSFFMSPRKFMELNVAINLLSGMLHHIWVEKDSNGVKTNIRYIDALILKDGKLSLVEGVDPDYAPGKKKFNELKNKIHSLNNRLQGTYAEFDQPESQRYIFMNMFYFYKKFFTSMLMNRWAEQRPSYSMGNVATGYHRSMLSSLRDMVKYKSFSQMTFEEKINAWKFMTDLAFQMVMFSFVSMFLGYDPNDEERFQKMKKRSGVKGLDKEAFNIYGYLTNHTLTSSLETLNELETFGVLSPISLGKGFDVNFIWGRNFKTITRTAEQQLQLDLLLSLSYKKLFEVLTDVEGLMRNDKSAYYSIDVGRFPWMKKGQPKLYRDLYSIFGVTGSQIDPITALKNYEYKIKRD